MSMTRAVLAELHEDKRRRRKRQGNSSHINDRRRQELAEGFELRFLQGY